MGQVGGMELILLFSIIGFVYLYILIDILKSEFNSGINKLVWLIVVFVMPILGLILYLLIAGKQKVRKS